MEYDIENIVSSHKWDKNLVALKGHPLQSALWGDARRFCDGIEDDRWCIKQNEQLIALLRVEHRGIGPFKKLIAWAPQGPTIDSRFQWSMIKQKVLEQLKLNKHCLLVTTPWERVVEHASTMSRQTIWINLEVGKEQLWKNLHEKCRYGARRAQRTGMSIETYKEKIKVDAFFKLCQQVSYNKRFRLNGSSELLYFLLNQNETPDVEGRLFLANLNHHLTGGAFILRVGKTIHYMWGGVDRRYSNERVGEYIQWQVIEWACSQGYHRYDLEGIDEIANPGVASFKKKMGGEVIRLPGKLTCPLNWQGRIAARFIRD